jgi:DNA-binding NarL/FixJ family response regulator
MALSSEGVDTGYVALKGKHIKELNGAPDLATASRDAKKRPDIGAIVVIESRAFVRTCILSNLSEATALKGAGVSTAEEYLNNEASLKPAIVIICAIGSDNATAISQLSKLKESGCRVPIVIMSDTDKIEFIMAIMEAGGNGYMPADISLEVAAHALRLILAGGEYFPINNFLAARRAMSEAPRQEVCFRSMFTKRQIAVIEALRKGKANKIIAYELNMCESTVKVHVRNIMKKLNAKNRTEVAYLAGELLSEQHP